MQNDLYILIRNQFNKKYRANQVKELDFIYTEIANRMYNRLNFLKLDPQLILDIGSGLNIDGNLLHKKYSNANILNLDLAINCLKKNYVAPKSNFFTRWLNKNSNNICANALKLPIKNNTMDMVWSNLVLPYVINDMEVFFTEIFRVLNYNGCFFVSGLGVDSLRQLRELGLNTYNFPDMHVIGDILVKIGFSNSVTDVEYITLEYNNINQLLNEVRFLGCGAITTINKSHNYLGKTVYNKIIQNNNNNVLKPPFKITLEVFYAHAWKDKTSIKNNDTTKIIKFDYLNKNKNKK